MIDRDNRVFSILPAVVCFSLLLTACQFVSSPKVMSDYRLELDSAQVTNLQAYLEDYLIRYSGRSEQKIAVAPIGWVMKGLIHAFSEGAAKENVILQLHQDEISAGTGSISWSYLDKQGQKHEEKRQFSFEELQAVRRILETWKTGTPEPSSTSSSDRTDYVPHMVYFRNEW